MFLERSYSDSVNSDVPVWFIWLKKKSIENCTWFNLRLYHSTTFTFPTNLYYWLHKTNVLLVLFVYENKPSLGIEKQGINNRKRKIYLSNYIPKHICDLRSLLLIPFANTLVRVSCICEFYCNALKGKIRMNRLLYRSP